MTYETRDYTIETAWSDADAAFVARVIDFPPLAAHGDTAAEAVAEAEVALALALEEIEAKGKSAPEPRRARAYNGRILVRVGSELHRDLVEEAERVGVSLNQLAVQLLARNAVRAPSPRQARAGASKHAKARAGARKQAKGQR